MIELQQYAKKNKPNLHILNKLQEEMKKLAQERVSICLLMFTDRKDAMGETQQRSARLLVLHSISHERALQNVMGGGGGVLLLERFSSSLLN